MALIRQNQFETAIIKWKKNSTSIMNGCNFFQHMQNGSTCKDKWEPMSGKFKKIFDPLQGNRHNEHYWMMSPQDKVDLYLSILFFKKVPFNATS
jgi:hypothetical protein